jgi:hypothetical protein
VRAFQSHIPRCIATDTMCVCVCVCVFEALAKFALPRFFELCTTPHFLADHEGLSKKELWQHQSLVLPTK